MFFRHSAAVRGISFLLFMAPVSIVAAGASDDEVAQFIRQGIATTTTAALGNLSLTSTSSTGDSTVNSSASILNATDLVEASACSSSWSAWSSSSQSFLSEHMSVYTTSALASSVSYTTYSGHASEPYATCGGLPRISGIWTTTASDASIVSLPASSVPILATHRLANYSRPSPSCGIDATECDTLLEQWHDENYLITYQFNDSIQTSGTWLDAPPDYPHCGSPDEDCYGCFLMNEASHLLYWPVEDAPAPACPTVHVLAPTITPAPTSGLPATQVLTLSYSLPTGDITYTYTVTSPTVYISIDTLFASDGCGYPYGEPVPGTIIPIDPGDLKSPMIQIPGVTNAEQSSSIASIMANQQSEKFSDIFGIGWQTSYVAVAGLTTALVDVNMADIGRPPPVLSYYFYPTMAQYCLEMQQADSGAAGWPSGFPCATIFDGLHTPAIQLGSAVRSLNPEWANCTLDFGYDPPSTLSAAAVVTGPSLPSTSKGTTASMTRPSQSKATTSAVPCSSPAVNTPASTATATTVKTTSDSAQSSSSTFVAASDQSPPSPSDTTSTEVETTASPTEQASETVIVSSVARGGQDTETVIAASTSETDENSLAPLLSILFHPTTSTTIGSSDPGASSDVVVNTPEAVVTESTSPVTFTHTGSAGDPTTETTESVITLSSSVAEQSVVSAIGVGGTSLITIPASIEESTFTISGTQGQSTIVIPATAGRCTITVSGAQGVSTVTVPRDPSQSVFTISNSGEKSVVTIKPSSATPAVFTVSDAYGESTITVPLGSVQTIPEQTKTSTGAPAVFTVTGENGVSTVTVPIGSVHTIPDTTETNSASATPAVFTITGENGVSTVTVPIGSVLTVTDKTDTYVISATSSPATSTTDELEASVTIGSSVVGATSGSDVVLGSATISVGGGAATVSGSTISVATNGIVVDGSTQTYAAISTSGTSQSSIASNTSGTSATAGSAIGSSNTEESSTTSSATNTALKTGSAETSHLPPMLVVLSIMAGFSVSLFVF